MTELKIEIIDRIHDRALVAAAKSMCLLTSKDRGETFRRVDVDDAQQAYEYGLESMKRWRSLLGRDRNLR